MAKAANSHQLRAAFEKHHDETEGQIERLEQIFELLGKPARGKKCDAIEGILDEGTEVIDEYKGETALDAGLQAICTVNKPASLFSCAQSKNASNASGVFV